MTKPMRVKNLILGEGLPKICVPLTGKTEAELCSQARKAVEAKADLVEWRMDLWCLPGEKTEEEFRHILEMLSEILGETVLLFTIRTKPEGGAAEWSEEEYEKWNLLAAESGKVSLVDVEVLQKFERKKELVEKLHKAGVRVVGSSHDFEKTEERESLVQRYKEIEKSGADLLKMAVMPKDFEDVASLMQAVDEVRRTITDHPLIAMSMGQTGMISRIAGENFGSCITFGTIGEASAPGQVPIQDLRDMMKALHEKNIENQGNV